MGVSASMPAVMSEPSISNVFDLFCVMHIFSEDTKLIAAIIGKKHDLVSSLTK